MRRTLSALLFLAGACEGEPKMTDRMIPIPSDEPVPPPPIDGNDRTVVLWFQDDPALLLDALMSGCRAWNEVGVDCARTEAEDGAEIRVLAVHDGCPTVGNVVTLGQADRRERTIVLMVDCFTRLAKNLGPDGAQWIFAHEVGHAIGLWYHIPLSCDDGSVQTHPNGELICGRALMNVFHDKDVMSLLRPDILAFDFRTELGAVIGQQTATCTFTISAP